MTRRTALFISAALTAFVIITVGVLAARLNASQADAPLGEPASSVDATGAAAADVAEPPSLDPGREELYRQRLEEANARLQRAYEDVRALNARVQALQQQNDLLLQREQVYPQRLQGARRPAPGDKPRSGRASRRRGARRARAGGAA